MISKEDAFELIKKYATEHSHSLGEVACTELLPKGEHTFAEEDVWLFSINLPPHLYVEHIEPNHYIFFVGATSQQVWTLQLL